MYQIEHSSFDGVKRIVHSGSSLENAVGYFCAISPVEVSRRTIRHSMTHPSFGQFKSFSASAADRGMLRLEWRKA